MSNVLIDDRPRSGAHRRTEWLLDPAVTQLNHGTVGAPGPSAAAEDDVERIAAAALTEGWP